MNKAGGGGGGGSSCAGPAALRAGFGASGAGGGRVVISPDHLAVTNSGSDVVDTNGNGRQDIGDQVDYTVTVRNDGAVAINDVSLNSTVGGNALALNCDRALPAGLSPGAAVNCSVRHTLTAADINRRSLPFQSTANGRSDSGEALTASATRTLALRPVPGMVVDVTAPVTDVNGNGLTDAGDTIGYTATVTNTGSGAIDQIAAPSLACERASLATGESTRCTATRVITQSDMDGAGTINASVTVTGRSVENGQRLANGPFAVATRLDQITTLAVTNTASAVRDVNGSGRPDAGDAIDYRVQVTDSGTVTIKNVTPALTGVTLNCAPADLAPGASLTCTGTYTVTQDDADHGSVTHTANATGDFRGQAVRSADVPAATEVPMVTGMRADAEVTEVVDGNGNGLTDAGDTIRYRVRVSNGGTLTMNDVAVELGPVAVSCSANRLLPGETTDCTGTYDITQADVDGTGPVEVTAVASASTSAGVASATSEPLRTQLSRVTGLAATSRVESIVDTNGNGLTDAGDVIDYAVVVTNTGTVTLNPVEVAMSPAVALDCGPQALAPAASVTCHGTHEITQSDVDSGSVHHEATASGRNPWGEVVTTEPSPTDTATDQRKAIVVTNSATLTDANGNGRTDAGDALAYTARATNTGTVTLTNVTVLEQPADGAGAVTLTCDTRTAAPAGVVTCTGSYPLTQDDVDRGTVTHAATAAGTAPDLTLVTSDAASTSTELKQEASLAATNAVSAADANGNGRVDAGEMLTYDVTVTNTGTVTLTDIDATEAGTAPADDIDLSCVPERLAPAGTATCTGTYEVTQDDVDSGAVTHTVTASGTGPADQHVVSAAVAVTTPLDRIATLTATNSATIADTNGTGRADTGDVVTYTAQVTNTGTVTLSGLTAAEAPTAPAGQVTMTCADERLAPGASTTCTGTYAVTQADVDHGSVTHTVTATGTSPDGTTVASAATPVTTALSQAAGLAVTISAAVADSDSDGRTDAGDVITYTVVTTNTGAVTLSEVAAAPSCTPATVAPGASVTCTTTHTVTAADEVAGEVVTTVTATGRTPSGEEVRSEPVSVRTAVAKKTPPAATQDTDEDLAWTGVTAVEEMLIAAAVLLVIGLGLLLFLRRRRRS